MSPKVSRNQPRMFLIVFLFLHSQCLNLKLLLFSGERPIECFLEVFTRLRYSTFLSIYKEQWADILKFRQRSMQSGSTLLPSPPLISRACLFTILVSLLSHSSRVAFPLISMCVVDLQLSNPKVHAMRDLLSTQAVYCTICLPRDQIGCSVAISAASG